MAANDPQTQLEGASEVNLVMALIPNKAKRNASVFFGVLSLVLLLWLDWSRWLLVVPGLLGLAASLYQMNIMLVTSELRKRVKEGNDA